MWKNLKTTNIIKNNLTLILLPKGYYTSEDFILSEFGKKKKY